jgi:hypothetical protein
VNDLSSADFYGWRGALDRSAAFCSLLRLLRIDPGSRAFRKLKLAKQVQADCNRFDGTNEPAVVGQFGRGAKVWLLVKLG